MFRLKRQLAPSPAVPSDRVLAAAMGGGDTAALGLLYDRYGPMLYALACLRCPAAEVMVEQVFADLWSMSQRGMLSLPIMPLLLDLVTQGGVRHPAPTVLTGQAAAPDALALLAQIGRSEPSTCAALVLVWLGKVTIANCAAVLEVEAAVVRQALGSGLALLRQLQPAATVDASHTVQPWSPSGVLVGIQAGLEGGVPSSVQQPLH